MSWFDLLPLLGFVLSYYLGYQSGKRYAKDALIVAVQNANQWAGIARARRISYDGLLVLVEQAREAARRHQPKPPVEGGDEPPPPSDLRPPQAP